MSYRTSYLFTFLLATFSIVPALATDITPIRCPANCPGFVAVLPLPVNTSAGDQTLPSVNGDIVAYSDDSTGQSYYYSVFSGATALIPRSSPDVGDYWVDVSGSKIVFSRYPDPLYLSIYIYDTANATTTLVDSGPNVNGSPSIGGQTVAYESPWGEITVKDYAFNPPMKTQLTTDGSDPHDTTPSVSPDGSRVVWGKCIQTSGWNCSVMQAVRSSAGTWTTTQLASFQGGTHWDPWPHADSQWIVYAGSSPTDDTDIYISSVDGTQQYRLLMPEQQLFPTVSGGVVFFSIIPDASGANTGNEYEMYMFQISTRRLWRLTDTPWDEVLNDISVQQDGSYHVTWTSGLIDERDVYAATIVLPSSVTPSDLLQQLINLVAADNLKQGISNSLDAKLHDAQVALDAARNNNKVTACNVINAFINEVNAQSGKSITTAQAQALLNLGVQIKQSLGCA